MMHDPLSVIASDELSHVFQVAAEMLSEYTVKSVSVCTSTLASRFVS